MSPESRRRNRPSFLALSIVVGALLVGGAGGAVAHGKIGTGDIKKGAVTTPKLHGNAVTSPKTKNATISKSDLTPSARARR